MSFHITEMAAASGASARRTEKLRRSAGFALALSLTNYFLK
jgi:hypothetical protein